ncbi:hypothetical protein LOTGIDRAFT_237836 [Lottia gigantea]|uniref:RRM domain-containing protein n=1 Tax=Lottia gigantea TaxID=225164 RepID=V4AZI7_LOTGI|nr:hypothetical protein LOTGIDRAFT_237836 [Lottia gigantea]ESP03138.1 hypothetical protein LOTGIDRAFT_237836 [Lottia gigantea]
MADLSLDDYMGKKNFKVQFQNNKAKVNTKVFQKKLPFGNGFKGRIQKTTGGLQTKKFQNKTAQTGGLQTKKFQNKTSQNDMRQKLSVTKNFDARQKLLQAKSAAAARDARQKIILSQKQKGTFDARSRIKKPQAQSPSPTKQQFSVTGLGKVKAGNGVQFDSAGGLSKTINTGGGVQIGGLGGLRKTLKNEFANGGSQVEMFGNSIQITRSVPNSQVSFDGNNQLTVTKRASTIKLSQPVKRAPSPIKWSDEFASPSPPKKANLIKTYKAADAIQIAASQAASARLRMPPPTTAKKTIPVITSPREEVLTPIRRRPPVIEVDPPRRRVPAPSAPVVKTKSVYRPVKVKQEPDEYTVPVSYDIDQDDDILSPLQGFKVSVTNLDPCVSQDDLIELFGEIGALKRAKISRPGLGEVVYVKKEDAQRAMSRYHDRELDGLPMQVKVVTPISARIQSTPYDNDDVSSVSIPDSLRFPKSSALTSATVEVPLIHRALFKTGPQTSTTPVTFTVKL